MGALDDCSSAATLNRKDFFMDDDFSAAAAKTRDSSGARAVRQKGGGYGFGASLLDESAFINVARRRYVVKRPELREVSRLCGCDGVEAGHDAYVREYNALVSFRELNNACVGSSQPLLERFAGDKDGYSLASTSYDDDAYDEFTGCLSRLCYASIGGKAAKQMKEATKRDKLVGEARRIQRRFGFASDRSAELLLKSYVEGANVDPTVFRRATLAYGPDLVTLSGKTVKVTEHGYERPPNLSPHEASCEMDVARFNGYAEALAVCHPGKLTIGHRLGPIQQGYNSMTKLRAAMEKSLLKQKLKKKRGSYRRPSMCYFYFYSCLSDFAKAKAKAKTKLKLTNREREAVDVYIKSTTITITITITITMLALLALA